MQCFIRIRNGLHVFVGAVEVYMHVVGNSSRQMMDSGLKTQKGMRHVHCLSACVCNWIS